MLGAEGYGALAAVLAAFLVLVVAGQAAQAIAAREAALEALGDLRVTLAGWTRAVLLATAAAALAGTLAREPLARLLGVPEHPWAAAAVLASGGLWLLVCLQRGVLQGLGAYVPMAGSLLAEPALRLAFAGVLVALGLDVTGAFLATTASLVALAVGLHLRLAARLAGAAPAHGRTRTLGALLAANRVPILGLLLLAALQNVDVVVARRELDEDLAGAYAASAVAAKTVVWLAVGVGLTVLPEAARRAAGGRDPRPVLLRALAVVLAIALPAVAVFAVAGEPVLRLAFGEELTDASGALPLLGLAMTFLAVALLGAQQLVALGDVRHVVPLAVLAVGEPLLLGAGALGSDGDATRFALVVLLACAAAAAVVAVLALAPRARWSAAAP